MKVVFEVLILFSLLSLIIFLSASRNASHAQTSHAHGSLYVRRLENVRLYKWPGVDAASVL